MVRQDHLVLGPGSTAGAAAPRSHTRAGRRGVGDRISDAKRADSEGARDGGTCCDSLHTVHENSWKRTNLRLLWPSPMRSKVIVRQRKLMQTASAHVTDATQEAYAQAV